MQQPPPPPPQGCGRGGRGALIMAALAKKQRLPNRDESPLPPPSEPSVGSSESGSSNTPKPLGRGALLQILKSASNSKDGSISSSVGSTSSMPTGRAALLAGSRGRTIGDVPDSSKSSVSPPVLLFQKMEINKIHGTEGKPINLSVNYIKLNVKPGMGIFEYHVLFSPQIDSKNLRFDLMKQTPVKDLIGETKSFDGAKLYLPHRLPDPTSTVLTTLPTDQTPVTLHIKYIGQSQAGDPASIHLYNLLFRKVMYKLKLTLVGRNYYNPRSGIPIPQHRLEVWPGYVTSAQQFEGGLMLNCDASFKVLRTNTARDVLQDVYRADPKGFQEAFIKDVVGCVIITKYNNRTYRIDDVNWSLTPSSKFSTNDGKEISFKEYYKNHYNIDIDDDKQPMLINKPKPTPQEIEGGMKERLLCLVPELCFMTGLNDHMRSDFRIMKDIAAHTRVTPEQRQFAFKQYIENIQKTPEAQEVLSNWGLEMSCDPLKVAGRQFSNEKIIVGRNKTFIANDEADWGRELTRENMLSAVNLLNWVVIYSKRDSLKAKDFIASMSSVCPAMGMKVQQPAIVELQTDRTEQFTRAAQEQINPSVQLIVFIFPTPRDDRYNAVKKLCCCDKPVASQVINAKTISMPQKLRSVVQKIGLQINCKLGGELWAVQIPLQKTMICGVDVYHDPTKGGRSVVGFVSSLNTTYTRWFSITSFQAPGQELADCLKITLLSGLKKFDEVNHYLPDKIIFYRDGVSDGQLQYVRDYEVPQMETGFSSFQEPYAPSLIVVVVQKRINTRLFHCLGNNLKNPPPGTILDHTVTNRNWFDFYLVSQHVRQGTVTPTHYIVVYNNSNLKPDHIQKLSYKLTHMYYNWPGTVRVPAPCQYAHKLAYLCGQNIHREPHKALEDKLFFL